MDVKSLTFIFILVFIHSNSKYKETNATSHSRGRSTVRNSVGTSIVRQPSRPNQRQPNRSNQRQPTRPIQRQPSRQSQRQPTQPIQRQPSRSDQRQPGQPIQHQQSRLSQRQQGQTISQQTDATVPETCSGSSGRRTCSQSARSSSVRPKSLDCNKDWKVLQDIQNVIFIVFKHN